MTEAMYREWGEGVLRRPAGDNHIEVLRRAGHMPQRLRLPLDDDWLEQFELTTWENCRPVYVTQGFVPRL